MHLRKFLCVTSALTVGLVAAANSRRQVFSKCEENIQCFSNWKENDFPFPTIELPKSYKDIFQTLTKKCPLVQAALDQKTVDAANQMSPELAEHKARLQNDTNLGNFTIHGFQIFNQDYYNHFCINKRSPCYVYEFLTKDKLSNPVKKIHGKWNKDPRLDNRFQRKIEDGRFDMGHMAAQSNHRKTELDQRQTLYRTNSSPQDARLNNGMWNRLENYCRNLTNRKDCKGVHVFTGPVWENNQGQGTVYGRVIPTHFFKIIVFEGKGTKDYKMECFLIPNKDSDGDIWQYRSSVKELNEKTSLGITMNGPLDLIDPKKGSSKVQGRGQRASQKPREPKQFESKTRYDRNKKSAVYRYQAASNERPRTTDQKSTRGESNWCGDNRNEGGKQNILSTSVDSGVADIEQVEELTPERTETFEQSETSGTVNNACDTITYKGETYQKVAVALDCSLDLEYVLNLLLYAQQDQIAVLESSFADIKPLEWSDFQDPARDLLPMYTSRRFQHLSREKKTLWFRYAAIYVNGYLWKKC